MRLPDQARLAALERVAHLARRTRQAQRAAELHAGDAAAANLARDYAAKLDRAIDSVLSVTLFDPAPDDAMGAG